MKHKIKFNRLSRRTAHRKSLIKNMATSLIKYERVKTTMAKAKEIRKTVEKFVTRAKVDSVHNRRVIGKVIQDKEILAKLFTKVGPRFSERTGGYTRIIKLGQRDADATEMVFLEFVDRVVVEKKTKEKKIKTRVAS